MVFKDIKDIDLTHVFECGQCFRWVPDGPDAYTGAAGSFAARVSLEEKCLNVEATGGDEAFWRHYFDLDTDYGVIKRKHPQSGSVRNHNFFYHIAEQQYSAHP